MSQLIHIRRICACTTAAVMLAACGSSEAPSGSTPTDSLTTIADGSSASTDVPTLPDVASVDDVGDTRDGSTDVVDDATGDGVAFCTTNDECNAGVCLFVDDSSSDGICSSFCATDEDCPAGSVCRLYSNTGDDAQQVCVPLDLCIDADGDGFGFGPACTAADCNDDNVNANLAADEVCDGEDNDCDGDVDEDPRGVGLPCETGFPGVCAAGETTCRNGLVTCESSTTGAEERCDDVDNDCDGAVDEGDDGGPLVRSCYSGTASTRDVGTCRAGIELCVDGDFTTCTGQVLPLSEICDSVDNDCNGQVDDGEPGAGLICLTGAAGDCSQGITRCEGGTPICQPLNAPAAERCDNRDNDCDGTIDNGNPGGGSLCNTGQPGVCSAGLTACSEGVLVCQQSQFATTDVCDGLDNNCNGVADEGNPGGGVACSTGRQGICEAGTTSCTASTLVCNQNIEASAEICDSLDNDCNGVVNNGCPDSITLGVGTASPQFADADGGSPFAIPCATGSAVAGFFGRSGAEIDAIGLVCAPLSLFERTETAPWRYEIRGGARTDTISRGGGGGSPFRALCPANEFVIGVNGRANDRMDAWQFTCGTFAINGNPGSLTVARTAVTTSVYVGGSGGNSFSYTCPENRIVTGISGRSGAGVDSISVTCSPLIPGVR